MSDKNRWDRIYKKINELSSEDQFKLIDLLKKTFPKIDSWKLNYTSYPSRDLIQKMYNILDQSGKQAYKQYQNTLLNRPGDDGEVALALALGVWYAQKQSYATTVLAPSTISPLVSKDYMKQSSVSPLVSRDSLEPSIGPLAIPKPNFNGAKLQVNSFR